MIGDLWRMVVGKYGYLTILYGLVTLYFAVNTVYAFSSPVLMPMLSVTSLLGLLTYKRALKFAKRKAERADGSLPFPGAPQ